MSLRISGGLWLLSNDCCLFVLFVFSVLPIICAHVLCFMFAQFVSVLIALCCVVFGCLKSVVTTAVLISGWWPRFLLAVCD